jgi:molybdenum cofactor cytidylyltransferase
VAETAIIILAAGNSSRLGRSKQLLVKEDGVNLLNYSIQIALESKVDHVLVVLGADYDIHKQSIAHWKEIHIVENKNWQKGMGSSLKEGLRKAKSLSNDLGSIILTVCDQVKLESRYFKALLSENKASDLPIVASRYDKTNFGVPVLFNHSLFEALLNLDDSHGALKFIGQNMEKVTFIDFKEGSADIDTEEDVRKYLLSKI